MRERGYSVMCALQAMRQSDVWRARLGKRTNETWRRYFNKSHPSEASEGLSQSGEGLNEGIKSPSEGLSEGLNRLSLVIATNMGIRTKELAILLGKSISSIERYLKVLKVTGKTEYRGSKKTGGYFICTE